VIDNTDSTLNGDSGHPHQDGVQAPGRQINVFENGKLVRTLPLNVGVLTIGRTPWNVLPLLDQSISRAHAELRVTSETVIVADIGSVNGTFVNGVQLAPHQPVQLQLGDQVRVGPFILQVDNGGAPAELDQELNGPVPEIPVVMPSAVFAPARPPRPSLHMPIPIDPVSTYLDFLPVIFGDSDFLGRFLLIFQSIWEPLEYRQDHIAMYFDPRTAPEPFLRWLAGWLGVAVAGVSEEGRIRTLLNEAVELYRWRGTRYGLTRMIEVCTGLTPIVAESQSNPAIFHIRLPVPAAANVTRDMVERLVNVNKPAHAGYILDLVSSGA
jgi:phage tail-like protein